MNWYLAKIVFRIICGDGKHTAQFDEQLRLISASTIKEAFAKGQLMGIREEETFYNRELQLVQWKFVNVSELYQLDELIDGAELYSRIEEKENAAAYIDIIYKKAEQFFAEEPAQLLKPA
ncbi:MAG: DUF4288 domain-containing protein [Chitinophagaceae bacterium]|nr:DUF4288 domain-containing protein [Chitinophagaceae bacterium]